MADTEKKINKSYNLIIPNCESSLENRISSYQTAELHKEIEYLKHRLSLIPQPIETLLKRTHELWWTVTSLLGLGYLHNGTRTKKQSEAISPSIALPKVPPQAMPTPRLFLDVTATYKSNFSTGVQRVIRELCRHGEAEGALAPVIINEGRFVTVPDLNPLIFQEGDRLLLLDSTWTITSLYPQALDAAKCQGATIILGIHDLIPLQYPGFVQPLFTVLFNEWLQTITPYCNYALAVSRYSAKTFHSWQQQYSEKSTITAIGWFHLGADFPKTFDEKYSTKTSLRKTPTNFLVSVGTIEPRKGYTIALDAFEKLWHEGSSLSYVIIGRRGDLSSHIIERITNHPQFGIKLFWPQNVDDQLLAEYYRNSSGLVIPSLAEGFGLPLIEATHHRKPIIASNLPVFKEIAPESVIFFSTADSVDLAQTIATRLDCSISAIPLITLDWQTATHKMISLIKNNDYQMRL